MKKVVIVIAVVICIVLISVYLVIPSKQRIFHSLELNCTESAAQRFMLNRNAWDAWWPGKVIDNKNLVYQNRKINIDRFTLKGFDFSINEEGLQTSSHLQVVYFTDMSAKLSVQSEAVFSAVPWKRVAQYLAFKKHQLLVESLANDLKVFFDKEENIYGFSVQKQKVKDSSLVSTRAMFNHYPDNTEIYTMISTLQKYTRDKNIKETGFPMLNVSAVDSVHYSVMVAIPVERDIASFKNIEQKKMVLGNILIAELKGGPATIARAESQMSVYIKDHKYVSPAIGFQSLVTNRLAEKDSTQWITRLCTPVF